MIARVLFGELEVRLADGWADTTADLPDGAPPTLACEGGTGVLQFTVATWRSGAEPHLDGPALRQMLLQFGKDRGLSRVVDWQGELFGASGDIESPDEFIRAWYLSDGRDVAFVTYLSCEPRVPAVTLELAAAEEMLRTARLRSPRRDERVTAKALEANPTTHPLLWEVLGRADSSAALDGSLARVSDAELRAICLDYFQARADLVLAIQESGRDDGASEDVLDDVAEAVLRQGPDADQAALLPTGRLPERSQWGRLEMGALRGAFFDAWDARFEDDLFDALERAP